jgi:hypothetical protein
MLSSPPPQFGNEYKQESLFYKTNKYFQIKKNDTAYHLAHALLSAYTTYVDLMHVRALQASKLVLQGHHGNNT